MNPSTGNPVFDYKAAFRLRAAALQGWLLKGGLLLAVGDGLAALLCAACRLEALLATGAGALSVIAGMLWGFYWRKKVQREFRETFGPPTSR